MVNGYNLRPDLTLDEALQALNAFGQHAVNYDSSMVSITVAQTAATEEALNLLGVDRAKMADYGPARDAFNNFFEIWDVWANVQDKFQVEIVFCPELSINRDWQPGTFRVKGPLARACRVCGCTDDFGCDEGCYWVEDDLCSACVYAEDEGSA